MSSFVDLVHLQTLLAATQGHDEVVIGLIDGVVDGSHPALHATKWHHLTTAGHCVVNHSLACAHGTFIAGVLGAARDSAAPGLCPGCQLWLRPIFCENEAGTAACPQATPTGLAIAIEEAIAAGARLINLSVGSAMSPFDTSPVLQAALDLAAQRGVLVVAAAGNQGLLGQLPLFNHPWLILAVACDVHGRVDTQSNLGPMTGRFGLLAPGVGVSSTASGGGYTSINGSSVAAAWVTGVVALLWSLYPRMSAAQLRQAVLLPSVPRNSIIPSMLNAAASWQALQQFGF